MSSSDQCALGPDGNLLDASEIVWQHDPDDPTPLMPPPSPKPTTLHAFFRGGAAPALEVGGSRRSVRVPKPSKRVLDADNVESASKSTSKRRKVSRKKIVNSEPEDVSEEDHVSDREEDAVADIAAQADDDSDIEMMDNADAEKAYLATKSMGDRDREVCFYTHLLL
jgi:hypothetical protein